MICQNKLRMRLLLLLSLLLSASYSGAQSFLSKHENGVDFKEIQRDFSVWKKGKDLSKIKYWKSFKRWESEIQLHTDATGNPADPDVYFDGLTTALNQKENVMRLSSTGAVNWLPSGPYSIDNNTTGMEIGIGRVNCMAFHPSDANTFYVGVAQGGLWKTSNGGQTWVPLTDNLPITRISDIAINPVNPDEIYISLCDFEYVGFGLKLNGRKRNTHFGLGVYKTTDGGVTWNPTGLSFQLTNGDASLIRKIIINQTNTNEVVACGTSGMYTSSDGGTTWNNVLDSLFWDMVQDPVNQNTLYAATGWIKNSNEGSAGIYKSTDFGATWTMLNTGIPATGAVQRIRLGVAPSDVNYIYAVAVDDQSGFYGIYKSVNAGTTWQFLSPQLNVLSSYDGTSSGGQGTYDLAFYIDHLDRDIIYTGGINIWGSIDGGVTFNPVSYWTPFYGPSIHADVHSIDRQPLTGNIFASTDGGIYRTTEMIIHNWNDAFNGINWPTLWTPLNDGRQVTSFYRVSSSKNSDGTIVAGAQDNSTFYYDGGITGWSALFGGDGMDNYIDPNSSLVVGSSQYGNFYSTTDGGFSTNYLNANINGEEAEWTTPVIADYNVPGLLYIGFENVVKSPDGGNTWTSLSPLPSSFNPNEISALAVAPNNSQVLYAAKRVRYEFNIPGIVYRSGNGGVTWTDITAGLPDSLYYTSVEINPANSSTAYISIAGFETGLKIYMTNNNGSTWQNISYNLPNLPVNCVKSLPGGTKLLAATDIGIYMLDSGSVNWVSVSNGLPNVIVSDIEINQALNKIYVSTFGRGIWEADLNTIITNINSDKTTSQMLLYPSINNGNFMVASTAEAMLTIVDIMGRKLFDQQLKEGKQSISCNLPSGKYFAKFNTLKSSEVHPFVVN